MLLTIDISNSTIKAGIFEGDALIAFWQFATERNKLADDYAVLLLNLFEAENIAIEKINGVSFSCVVPPLRFVFTQFSKKYLHIEPFVVSPTVKTGVTLAHEYPLEVGGDRIANAFATYRLYGGPAISIAFGTATVFDCISDSGVYLGGAIAPGIVGALESLTQTTALLFKVDLKPPPNAIGTNTIHTMQSGLIYGFAGMVEGLVSRLKSEVLKSNPSETFKIIATGGLAEVITPEVDVIDIVDQELTLKGLRFIYELNNN